MRCTFPLRMPKRMVNEEVPVSAEAEVGPRLRSHNTIVWQCPAVLIIDHHCLCSWSEVPINDQRIRDSVRIRRDTTRSKLVVKACLQDPHPGTVGPPLQGWRAGSEGVR